MKIMGGSFAWHEKSHLQKVLKSVEQIMEQGTAVPVETLTWLVKGCTRRNDLVVGRRVLLIFIEDCLQWNYTELGCLLIRMFALCGHLLDALTVFSCLHYKNVYAWTAIILACARNGQGEQAIILYKQMQLSAVKASPHTFVAVLKACATSAALDQGKRIHGDLLKQGLALDLFVGCALVGMYTSCGSLLDARSVFDHLLAQDDVSCSVMIGGYVQHGQISEAIKLFNKLQQEGTKPNRVTFVCLLKACASRVFLLEGKWIHEAIMRGGIESDLHIGSSLVNMYAKCNRLGDACEVFGKLPLVRDVVSWNAIISGNGEHGHPEKVFWLYDQMKEEGANPNGITFMSIVKACSRIEALDQGRLIHSDIIGKGFDLADPMGSSLVEMYAKCWSLEDACYLFDKLPVHDVVSCSVMIAGYVHNGHGEEALQLYANMWQTGAQADEVTFVCLLKACGQKGALDEGHLIHADVMKQKLEANLFVGSSLVDMYAKCGSLESAQKVFNKLPVRNLVTWSAMIAGYADGGHGEKALQLFTAMQQLGIEADKVTFVCILKACASISALDPGRMIHASLFKQCLELNILIGSTLVDMYAKCGSLEDAFKIFDKLPARDTVLWSVMISAYTEHGLGEKALQLFDKMQQEGLRPNRVTFLCSLKACSNIAAVEQGKLIHADIKKQGFQSDSLLGSALIDMYAKCGNLECAQNVFDTILARDVVLWSAMISGYVENGCAKEALHLYERMQQEGTEPNEVTFLCILKACSIAMSLHCGNLIHSDIRKRGLESDLFIENTIVDMYAKCGNLEDALEVFEKLLERNLVAWSAMIAGFAEHGHHEISIQLFNNMQQEGIKPDGVIFLSLLFACSHVGLVQEGLSYFHSMRTYYGLLPMIEHYICMVDILGRAGCLEEAEELALKMPFQPTSVMWVTLLGSSAKYGNAAIGRQAFHCLLESDCSNAVGYVLMSNIYATDRLWEEVQKIHEMRICNKGWKLSGIA